jgi:hypothetical protein
MGDRMRLEIGDWARPAAAIEFEPMDEGDLAVSMQNSKRDYCSINLSRQNAVDLMVFLANWLARTEDGR